MQIEILGSGGAITTPKPGCVCRVCGPAREKGLPYSRTGPSLFVHGPDVLIDTPEEIKQQLNRSLVKEIKACFYSHWHPDHTMGRRVWEMNMDWLGWPPHSAQTQIYLPQQVAADFGYRLGAWEHFAFMEQRGVIRIIRLHDGDAVTLNQTRILPFRLAADYVYAFLFEEYGRRILIAPDELVGWDPPSDLIGLDLAIVPMGILEFDPFTGERRIPQTHPVLKYEATFLQTVEILRKLNPRRAVMTHIEEVFRLTPEDLEALARKLEGDGLNVTFAYDTMLIEV